MTDCYNDYEDTANDEFFDFAENVATSYVEMWNAKYGGAFVDHNGDNIFIKKVIYKNPKVIIFWNDGTKSMSSCSDSDPFSYEAGLAIAVMNRVYGYDEMNRLYDDWLPEEYSNKHSSNIEQIVDIRDVRKKYKHVYKLEDMVNQAEMVIGMKEYLESCGFKVTKK